MRAQVKSKHLLVLGIALFTPVVDPAKGNPNYHFMNDMTTQAIHWIRAQQSLTPDKPFFTYFVPGATHAPHHVPESYIKKHEGKFAEGWDVIRERIFENQKRLGVIPQDTQLSRKPKAIKKTGLILRPMRRRCSPARQKFFRPSWT